MPATIDYKSKYLELRSKYMNDLDTAFRFGFEAGAQQSQQKQALDAQAQNQESEQQQKLAEAGGMGAGQPPHEGSNPPQEGAQPGAEQPGGSELDQHIGKLESMLGSSDDAPKSPEQNEEIQKSLNAIISLRKAEKFALEMKKSEQAINGIAKALHKPAFKLGVLAQSNLTDNAKQGVSLQHKIVNDMFKSWEEEEEKAANSIENLLRIENLIKE